MSENIQDNNLPFKGPVSTTEFPRQFVLNDNPEILIRKDGNNPDTKELHETAVLIEELDHIYGIKSPGYNPVIVGQNREDAKILTITRKILGVSLVEAAASKRPEVLESITDLYNGLTKYLEEKYAKNEKYLGDIYGNHQYMYGHVAGEDADRIYLTDIGGHISDPDRYAKVSPEFFSDSIILNAIYMYQDITAMTDRTGQEFPALERIVGLLNYVPTHNETLNEAISLINSARSEGKFANVDEIERITDAY